MGDAAPIEGVPNESEREKLYRKFDEKRVWEVFTLPSLKVTVEEAVNRTGLSNAKLKLSEVEVKERANWAEERKSWSKLGEVVEVDTAVHLLEQRILPPVLHHDAQGVSRTSSKKETRDRIYPPCDAVLKWILFDDSVPKFQPQSDPGADCIDPWAGSAMARGSLSDESDERGWLKQNVLTHLRQAKLLDHERTSASTMGSPDLCLYAGSSNEQSVVACVEVKSTHNLWLPSNADDLVSNYRECWDSPDLNYLIAHPIGQLTRSMILNHVQYGVISSATRTYFVRLCSEDGTIKLLVSRRWYVGEPDYLRSWAKFYDCAKREIKVEFPKHLFRTWKSYSPKKAPFRKSPRTNDNVPEEETVIASLRVDYDDIEYTGAILGEGKNGFVREALWNNLAVAVKLFDFDHGAASSFHQELEAYVKLSSAQGILIPKLYFWAKHWTGSLYAIGLQLGTSEPFFSNRDTSKEKDFVLKELTRLGYAHMDSEDLRNFTYLPDGNGGHRIVIIDLESLEQSQPLSPLTQSSDDGLS